MKKIIFTLSIAALMFSCNNDNSPKTDATIQVKDGDTRSKLSAGSENAEELKEKADARQKEREAREKEKMANLTTMDISPKVFDFGNIAKEKPVTTYFTITNTGDKPLIINETKASCGCTVPEKPEEPIMPGEDYKLEVTFTSNPSQAGTSINKTITVSGNVPETNQVVNIKGNVSK